MTFEGKTVFVTGAGSGIGQATAIAFAGQSANIVMTDLDRHGLDETVAIIGKANDNILALEMDVTRDKAVAQAIQATIERFGQLDITINNAGVFLSEGQPHEVSVQNWNTTINVNLTGVYLCMRHQIPPMLKQGSGCILNMSSVLGLRGAAGAPAYSASKHAIIGLTKSAAIAYAENGIRVNAVCPGIIETPMEQDLMNDQEAFEELLKLYPMRRSGTPDEVVQTILWLCSDAASYMTGIALPIDGGHMAY